MKTLSFSLILIFAFGFSISFAQITETGYYNYLHESFSRQDEDVYEYLIDEFQNYLLTFPDSPNADESLFMLASLYDARSDYSQAFCVYVKLKFLYPNSTRVNDAVTAINDIVHNKAERTFEDYKTKVDEKITNTPQSSDMMSATYEYLNFLHDLNIDDVNKYLLNEINTHLHKFPIKAKNSDQLFLWIADLYEKDSEWDEAIYTYTKITYLYPESPLMPEVIFKRSDILYKEKRAYQQARDSFIRVITDYPKSEFAAEAQFFLGELYQENLDNPAEAITNYQLVVESYPKSWRAVEALKRVAGIHVDAERYQEGINSYYQIYELYPENAYTPDALIEISDLYQDRLKNYEKAIEILKLFSTQFSDHKDAAEHLFEAGEIYEDDLERKQAAIDTFHEVKNKFPNSEYAERAQDRIEDLSKD
jgi:TolA-binding protein